MESLPYYIPIVFILTTLLTLVMVYKANNKAKLLLLGMFIWMVIQAVISLSGFYTVTAGIPPRFALLLIPPVLFIIILFLLKKGLVFIDGFDTKTLIMLHIVRIPVELTLYWLFLNKKVPQLMTFEGRNFDIFCGLTAPLIYYFGYIKAVIGWRMLLAWNIICLGLLLNIVVIAVLSAPFTFQRFAFNQPDIALFYFPFIWLPCCVVPLVLFAHLATIKVLLKGKPVTAVP